MLAFIGGMALALGGIWLFVDAALRYAVRHDVRIVNWAGRRPTTGREQEQLNVRLDKAQDRELNRLRTLRPVPVVAVVTGVVLIVVASLR